MNEDVYRAWRQKADEDLLAASNLLDDGGPYPTICFLSQQGAEKYLKGYLLFKGRTLRKIHFLDRLLEDCVELDPSFHDLLDPAVRLTQYYLTTRYPDDVPEDIFEPEARDAYAAGCRIREFVGQKIDGPTDADISSSGK
jgi:HEPN domain-containing protein